MENVKIPAEVLSNCFRKHQKHISKEMSSLQEKITELQAYLDGSTPSSVVSSEEVVVELRKLEDRVIALLDHLIAQDAIEKNTLRQLNARLLERKTYPTINDVVGNDAAIHRSTVMLIGDMLLRHGLLDAADALAAEHGADLSFHLDSDIYRRATNVETALQAGDVDVALVWCADHGSKLRRLNSSLEFYLRQEQFLQLVYQKRTLEALQLAQTKLAPLVMDNSADEGADASQATVTPAATPTPATTPPVASSPSFSSQRPRAVSLGSSTSNSSHQSRSPFSLPFSFSANPLSFFHYINPTTPSSPPTPVTPMHDTSTYDQVKYKKEAMCHLMSMLAFTEDGAGSYGSMVPHLYEEKYSDHRRNCLVDLFKLEFRRVYGVTKVCPLERLLQFGLFALKTPVCKTAPKSPRISFDFGNSTSSQDASRASRRSGQRLSFMLSGGEVPPPTATTTAATTATTTAASANPASTGSAMLNAFRRLQGTSAPAHAATHARRVMAEDRVLLSTGAHENIPSSSSASLHSCDAGIAINNAVATSPAAAITECPVCTSAGQIISNNIPAAIRGSSVLKCRASGLLMTQDNPPLACPNGQVFCKEFVLSHVVMVKKRGSANEEDIACFTCPVTKQVFEVDRLRQVYIT